MNPKPFRNTEMHARVAAGVDSGLSDAIVSRALGITKAELREHFQTALDEGLHVRSKRQMARLVLLYQAGVNGSTAAQNSYLAPTMMRRNKRR